jgi:hypothetical protein
MMGGAMIPSERDLEVAYAATDRARRRRLAALLAFAVALALALPFSLGLTDLPLLLALAVLSCGLFVAWRGGALERALAFLALARLRADGLAATERLNQGDIEGAQRAFAALLPRARPLGAFHATHVLMYGVTRYLQGDTQEGLRLACRALDSGWFSFPSMRALRDAAESWRVLMLLSAGRIAEARQCIDALPDARLVTARVALALFEDRWEEASQTARSALVDPGLPKLGRPTVAALGLFAARKLAREEEVRAFAKVLEAEPLGELAKRNPALRGFL